MDLSYKIPSLSETTLVKRFDEPQLEMASIQEGATQGNRSSSSVSSLQRGMTTAVILLGLMFSCVDTSIISTALVTVSSDLGDYLNAPWAVLAYLMTYMSFAVGFSKLSDIYGRRDLMVVAWIFFGGFSIGCALSQTMSQLIAFRAAQGIGGSGLYALSQTSLVEQGPPKAEIIGALIGMTLSISYVLGPLLGGGITSGWSWRGIFWINTPASCIAIICILVFWPPENRQIRGRIWESFIKIDFLGNLLLVAASFLLVFSIQEGSSFVWRWHSPVIVGALATSGACWIFLSLWESFVNIHRPFRIEPIFPCRIFSARVYVFNLITTLLTGFMYIAIVIEIPERLQIINGDTPLTAGVHLLPMLGACAFASFVAGIVSKRRNRTSESLIVGSVLQLFGTAFLYGLPGAQDDETRIFGFTAIYGFGAGLCLAAATMMTAVEARNTDLAAAQGAISQARVLGGALGLSACTIIFNNMVSGRLSSLSTDELNDIYHTPMAIMNLPPGVQIQVVNIYLGAFTEQMYLMMWVAVACVICSIGTYQRQAASVNASLVHHKDSPARASDTELESLGSIRSVQREV